MGLGVLVSNNAARPHRRSDMKELTDKINAISRRSISGEVFMTSDQWNEIVALVEEQLDAAAKASEAGQQPAQEQAK